MFRKDEVIGTKVLTCGLDPRFELQLRGDAEIYARCYPATTVVTFNSVHDITQALARGFDIVHLLADVTTDGGLADSAGNTLSCAALVHECCARNVKLLWIATDNPAENYIAGLKPGGQRLNLVATLARKGETFSRFLQNLLTKMSSGTTMPVAWNELCPQVPGREQQTLYSSRAEAACG